MAWIDPKRLDADAIGHGFVRRGKQNWVRRTGDFVQLVNLQKSAWSTGANYLNFALWPLAFGEPPSIAASKFHFRMRVDDSADLFALADRLQSLHELRQAMLSENVLGLATLPLQRLLDGQV
ncbi:DUF4304 domain-containing protein [Mesorhizobium sp. ASY16-5R]|uniref:DUF4304 domain-containing protein n=1 Tax=Mesorhizobium sp. ASY16-5R TaxID=3445772 RepID=UPI003F9ED5D7